MVSSPLILRYSGNDNGEIARQIAGFINKGFLAVIPTDTVYGVAADPNNVHAVEKLYTAKGREKKKPVPLLASDLKAVIDYGARMSEPELKVGKKLWPGALTLVLEADGIQEGFRIPDCEITREVLSLCGGVLRVTSANVSGEEPALAADDAIRTIGSSVAVVLDAGRTLGGTASTVARIEGEKVEILRHGPIGAEEIIRAISGKGN